MQRITTKTDTALDASDKSLGLRYAEVLALRDAIQKEISAATESKKPKRTNSK
ncbi:hypothetical protein G8O24_32875 [Bradyrhizobium sp. INPA01-394B]|uniref:Uncharacterized protein n=1 Tax=Bradyrhizobium campsiandrae TaxID=1729892 RepID=A0ABR7UAV2_9BRAD|nr:hypothetical protein [Bradyrhizobium campsiandrae]MBC9882127.1 hypothetical protein [Bradyrhizobium campsiandrae]MBC9981049.1 hypothetical protein [Bradyrhizobium campsiandrae]